MTTHSPKLNEIKRDWHVVDADGEVLGRVSSRIAQLLIGKHKTNFVPHLDCGDYVVVVNAKNLRITGNKELDKIYHTHSGYPGGLKSISFKDKFAKDPVKVLELSVKGMLPKNKLRDPRLRRLKVFLDTNHIYQDKLNTKK